MSATPRTSDALVAVRHISIVNAVAAVGSSLGVIVAYMIQPRDEIVSLLVFPIWIVARSLGLIVGSGVALCGLGMVGFWHVLHGVPLGPGYVVPAIVLAGAVAAGDQAALKHRVAARAPNSGRGVRLLTSRPLLSLGSEGLTHRELEILQMVATGAKNAQIAARYVISENTVKSHVGHILKKLAVANRTEAASRYIEMYGDPKSPTQTMESPGQ